jgi:hypothetical protein
MNISISPRIIKLFISALFFCLMYGIGSYLNKDEPPPQYKSYTGVVLAKDDYQRTYGKGRSYGAYHFALKYEDGTLDTVDVPFHVFVSTEVGSEYSYKVQLPQERRFSLPVGFMLFVIMIFSAFGGLLFLVGAFVTDADEW